MTSVYKSNYFKSKGIDFDVQINAKPSKLLFDEAIADLLNPKPSIHLKNFPTFSNMIGGLRSNELTIFSGGTCCGKTQFLSSVVADVMSQNIPCFVASVETGHSDFLRRTLSAFEGTDLNTGKVYSKSEIDEIVRKYADKYISDNLILSLFENRFSVEELIAHIEWANEKYGCRLAVIDNLNFFLEVTSAQNSVIEMDRVLHELVIFSKTSDVHLILVMHPKKTDTQILTSEFDIKGSSTAVQEAHNVLLFNRLHEDVIAENPYRYDNTCRQLKVQKMRRRGLNVGRSALFKLNDGKYVEVL